MEKITFSDWILSNYPENSSMAGQWGWRHILTMIICAIIILLLTALFDKKDESTRRKVICVLAGMILFFEISRRLINLYKTTEFTLDGLLYTLLPRPWCAISCWSIIIAAIFNKKFLYNFATMSSLLCAIIFFAYPGAGFNDKYILFENIYSISTHALLLITSITMMTLKITDFRYKSIIDELICFCVIYIYAFIEILVLKIATDPLYFMPNNEVHEILGLPYLLFLFVYIAFVFIYINLFYFINEKKYKKIKR